MRLFGLMVFAFTLIHQATKLSRQVMKSLRVHRVRTSLFFSFLCLAAPKEPELEDAGLPFSPFLACKAMYNFVVLCRMAMVNPALTVTNMFWQDPQVQLEKKSSSHEASTCCQKVLNHFHFAI